MSTSVSPILTTEPVRAAVGATTGRPSSVVPFALAEISDHDGSVGRGLEGYVSTRHPGIHDDDAVPFAAELESVIEHQGEGLAVRWPHRDEGRMHASPACQVVMPCGRRRSSSRARSRHQRQCSAASAVSRDDVSRPGTSTVNQTTLPRPSCSGATPQSVASARTIRRPRPEGSSGRGDRIAGCPAPESATATADLRTFSVHAHREISPGVPDAVGRELGHHDGDRVGDLCRNTSHRRHREVPRLRHRRRSVREAPFVTHQRSRRPRSDR